MVFVCACCGSDSASRCTVTRTTKTTTGNTPKSRNIGISLSAYFLAYRREWLANPLLHAKIIRHAQEEQPRRPFKDACLVSLPSRVVSHEHATSAPLALCSIRCLHFEDAAQYDDELAIRRHVPILIEPMRQLGNHSIRR